MYFFFNRIFFNVFNMLKYFFSCSLCFQIFGFRAFGRQNLNHWTAGKSLGNIFPNILEEDHSKESKAQQFRNPGLEGNQNDAEDSPSSYCLIIYGE